jgi:putative acetyltransferase
MNNLVLKRTNSNDADFKSLIILLDGDLHKINGAIQSAYNEHNLLDFIETVVVSYIDGAPAGCGCFKKFDNDTIEIKRMFVRDDQRGKGIAAAILTELELWAGEIGYQRAVLETGLLHAEAIGLYKKFGYMVTENYPPYVDMPDSICFRKTI